MLQQPFGLHGRFDGVEHDADGHRQLLEKGQLQSGERPERSQFDDRFHMAFEQHRQHDDMARRRLEQARADGHDFGGNFRDEQAPRIARALADESLAQLQLLCVAARRVVRVGRQQLQSRYRAGFDLVNDSVLRLHQRRQFREHQPSDRRQVTLPLQHVGEARQVGLEPILFGIAIRRQSQVADHRIDVVFQLRHLAARFHLHGARQVSLGDGGGHLGDGAHLGGEIRRQQVHVAGQILPGPGSARHVGLAAKPAFDADLARHRRHLVGERREGIGHVVDGLGQRRDLALGCHGEILLQIAVRDRGHDLHDASHLLGEIRGHDIDRVREILPGARHPRHLRLAAEPPLGAHLARHARHLSGETIELIDHGVDGVLELEDFALHVHSDLARQIAARHRRGDFRDVAHLSGEIRRQQVDVVGEVLPGARHAGNHGLPAQAAVGADFARHAGHFTGERAQLVHHRIQRFLQ